MCKRKGRTWRLQGLGDKYEYGKRWLAESVLSAVKRIFGETVRATSIDGMFREARMKFMCYNTATYP